MNQTDELQIEKKKKELYDQYIKDLDDAFAAYKANLSAICRYARTEVEKGDRQSEQNNDPLRKLEDS